MTHIIFLRNKISVYENFVFLIVKPFLSKFIYLYSYYYWGNKKQKFFSKFLLLVFPNLASILLLFFCFWDLLFNNLCLYIFFHVWPYCLIYTIIFKLFIFFNRNVLELSGFLNTIKSNNLIKRLNKGIKINRNIKFF